MKIIECPRDAMQGMHQQIPTSLKIKYIQALLEVGFDTIDFGSFVSPKAVPQMADTAEVLDGLDLQKSQSHLLAIIANKRGAEDALQHKQIDYLGFPFSISETFQQKNTNKSMDEAYNQIQEIQELILSKNKKLVIYLSMGFGNPYGDIYDPEVTLKWADKFRKLGVHVLSVADTLGMASPDDIVLTFDTLSKEFKDIEFGAHFHSTPQGQDEKLQPAYDSGCRRFDSALKGLGGCPLSGNDLVGNIDTGHLVDFLERNNEKIQINPEKWSEANQIANKIVQYQ